MYSCVYMNSMSYCYNYKGLQKSQQSSTQGVKSMGLLTQGFKIDEHETGFSHDYSHDIP